jgi:hypothetical protein
VYHTIRFVDDLLVQFVCAGRHRRAQLLIPKGTPVQVQIQPYVRETEKGPVEMADLLLEAGPVVHRMPWACFAFVD